MPPLLYCTTNSIKFNAAFTACQELGVVLNQKALEVPELQSDDASQIALQKAQAAFDICDKPLIVTDDSWLIPGLKGFPGPFMKYMNQWFNAEDWLRLTEALDDRRIVLRQVIAYIDSTQQKTFSHDIEATLLREARGTSPYSHLTITSYNHGKTSRAEDIAANIPLASEEVKETWHQFVAWYTEHHR